MLITKVFASTLAAMAWMSIMACVFLFICFRTGLWLRLDHHFMPTRQNHVNVVYGPKIKLEINISSQRIHILPPKPPAPELLPSWTIYSKITIQLFFFFLFFLLQAWSLLHGCGYKAITAIIHAFNSLYYSISFKWKDIPLGMNLDTWKPTWDELKLQGKLNNFTVFFPIKKLQPIRDNDGPFAHMSDFYINILVC